MTWREHPSASDFGAEYLSANLNELVLTRGIALLPESQLVSLLLDDMTTCTEVNLFIGTCEWVKANAPERVKYDKALLLEWAQPYIRLCRLGTFDVSDITKHVSGSGLVTSEDILGLLDLCNIPQEERQKSAHKSVFSCVTRKGTPLFNGSKILSTHNLKQDMSTIVLTNAKGAMKGSFKTSLIWQSDKKASQTHSDIHKILNKTKDPTLILLKLQSGNIVGGYYSKQWNFSGGGTYGNDPAAFLCGIIPPSSSSPKRTLCKSFAGQAQYATYMCSNYGPVFGSGHDLLINANLKTATIYVSSYTTSVKGMQGYSTALFGNSSSANIDQIEIHTVQMSGQ